MSSRRRLAFLAIAIVFLFVMVLFPGLGLTDLIDGFSSQPGGLHLLSAGHGIMAAIILPLGLLPQFRGASRKIAGPQQIALVAVAIAVAALIGTSWLGLVEAAIIAIFLTPLIVLHPARHEVFSWAGRWSPVLASLTVLAAVPCISYALATASNQRASQLPSYADSSLGLGGWAMASAVAIAIVLLALLAALQTSGWRVTAWSAGIAAVAYGLSSMIHPGNFGNPGRAWAILAMAWGVVFMGIGEWEARRSIPSSAPASRGKSR